MVLVDPSPALRLRGRQHVTSSFDLANHGRPREVAMIFGRRRRAQRYRRRAISWRPRQTLLPSQALPPRRSPHKDWASAGLSARAFPRSLEKPAAQAPLVGITAGGLATPTNSAMDLAFLADAAAAATLPTDRALGALDMCPAAGRHYNQSLAATAVASLRGSEAALASIAAAATEIDNGAPIPPPLSSQEFISTSVPSRSIATVSTPAAAEAGSDGGASGDWSSINAGLFRFASNSRRYCTCFARYRFGCSNRAGACRRHGGKYFPGVPRKLDRPLGLSKTLRVRGAMMSRLKSVRRTTVAG